MGQKREQKTHENAKNTLKAPKGQISKIKKRTKMFLDIVR